MRWFRVPRPAIGIEQSIVLDRVRTPREDYSLNNNSLNFNVERNTFETLCHAALPELYREYTFTQLPSQWWYKGREIDVVAPTDEATLLVGEAKFTNAPLGYDVLAGLEDDARAVDWTPSTGADPTYEHALFSRSGFKPSVEEAAAEREDLQLFALTDVVDALERDTGE